MNTLFIVATPIGNLDDITIRAIKTLLAVPVIACEDTRHTGQLIKILKERYPQFVRHDAVHYISIRDWNESDSIEKILFELHLHDVALVSDAGTPLLSDPGFKLVRAARQQNLTVVPIPGPFAAAAALSAAGLPTNKFLFWGFLPKTWDFEPGLTHVVYESPMRYIDTIDKIFKKYPLANIVIANELTKVHEVFVALRSDSPLPSLKGEVTLLVYIPNE